MSKKGIWSLAYLRLSNGSSKFIMAALTVGITFLTVSILLMFTVGDAVISSGNSLNDYACFLVSSNYSDTLYIRNEESADFVKNYGGHQLTAEQYNDLRDKFGFDEITWLELAINAYGKIADGSVELQVDGDAISLSDTLRIKFFNGYSGLGSLIPQSFISDFIERYGKEIIKGGGFTDGNRELLISEEFLDSLDIEWQDVIGKTISLTISYSDYGENMDFAVILDDDNIFDNPHKNSFSEEAVDYGGGTVAVFADFKVVGVIDRDYFSLNEFTECEAPVWMLGGALSPLPQMSVQRVYTDYSYKDKVVVTYPETDYEALSKEVTEAGYVFPFLVGNWFSQYEYDVLENYITPVYNHYIHCGDMTASENCYTKINELIKTNNGGIHAVNSFYRNEFLGLISLVKLYKILLVAVGAVSAVILITVLIVYMNTANLNVRKLKRFGYLLECLGMNGKEIKCLRFFEMILLIAISAAAALVSGLAISLLLNFGVQSFMSTFGMTLSLKLVFFLPSFLIAILFVSVILAPYCVLVKFDDERA